MLPSLSSLNLKTIKIDIIYFRYRGPNIYEILIFGFETIKRSIYCSLRSISKRR